MLGSIRKFFKRESGVAATELALVTPVFLMLFLSMIELGHMIYYSITVEKALRSAATWAGRNEELTAAVITATENIAKTGNPNGTADDYLVKGWEDSDASVTVVESTYTETMTGQSETIHETVYSITVSVPYVPVVDVLVPALEYLMKTSFQNGKYMIVLTHDQAMIGN
jgi:Flp pilus assembly protein TadG